jgi:hypothetical protein
MLQYPRVVAARLFEGVGQDREPVERPVGVNRLGQSKDRRSSPSVGECGRPKRITDDAAEQIGHHCPAARHPGVKRDVPGMVWATRSERCRAGVPTAERTEDGRVRAFGVKYFPVSEITDLRLPIISCPTQRSKQRPPALPQPCRYPCARLSQFLLLGQAKCESLGDLGCGPAEFARQFVIPHQAAARGGK